MGNGGSSGGGGQCNTAAAHAGYAKNCEHASGDAKGYRACRTEQKMNCNYRESTSSGHYGGTHGGGTGSECGGGDN